MIDAEALQVLRVARPVLVRYVPQEDLSDYAQEVCLQVLQSGGPRQQDCLPAFVRTIARRVGIQAIRERYRAGRAAGDPEDLRLPDHSPSPETLLLRQERSAAAARVLPTMNARDRELIVRFYLREQSEREICGAMGITWSQYHNYKSRAVQFFGDKVRTVLL